jgi:septal ring-binding cell division protein DamX
VGWHEIRLTGFSAQDVREYLEWRFQEARYRGRLPFTDQQVKDIARLSEGLPGKIDQMANVLMLKLETGDIGARARFPALHWALSVLLLVLVALASLLWQQGLEIDEAEFVIAAEQVPETVAAPVAATAPPAIAPRLEDVAALESIAGEAAAPENTSAAEPAPSELGAVAGAAAKPAQASPPVAESIQEPVAVSLPAATAEPDNAAEPDTAGSVRDGGWLIRQPEDTFTIQLVTLSSAERVRAYLALQTEGEQFATYRLQRDGRVLHVVVFGVFGSRVEAQAAADRLPGTVGDVRPWVRPMDQVHGAIRTALQQ